MAIFFKFLIIFLVLFWLARFFSRKINRLWSGTIGVAIQWLNDNGARMMKFMFILAGVLFLVFLFQWSRTG
ncbi:hypothetical protein [Advenella faeciporci]|uniref:hypothetical protein n=1 Tax=Advenella faeciporci TaxID=797535 RepID=UPI00167B3A5F|nr:hypothetical protein [Advenella faeciporci]